MCFASIIVVLAACILSNTNQTKENNKELEILFNRYWEDRMRLYPLEATATGDYRYNDVLPIDFTESFRDSLHPFYTLYQNYLLKYDRGNLNTGDQFSYDVFKGGD